MKYRHVKIGGKRMAYKVAGEGPVIALLHGWPQSSYMWRKTTAALAANHQVMLIDLPGLGETDSHNAFDMAFVSGVVAETIAAIGIQNFHLVGHDVGAWVATALALQFEARLKSLTVVDAAIPGLMPADIFGVENAARVWQFYFHALEEIPELLTKDREKEYLSWYFRNKSIVKEAINEDDLEHYAAEYRKDGCMSHGFAYYRAFLNSSGQIEAYKTKLAIPVLALGAESGTGKNIGVALEKIALKVTTRVIPGCGHYVAEEQPALFSKLLLEFIGRHELRT